LRDVALAAPGEAPENTFALLVETLAPFGAPAFPAITSAELVTRINTLFHLGEGAVFTGSLRAFSSLGVFVSGSPQLFAAERMALPNADVRDLAARDGAAFKASGLSQTAMFGALGQPERDGYVRLWSQSAFNTRRRFYGSVRAVTFIALYSLPETWPVINYAGPLIHRKAAL
jgi:hypothetical protein